MALLLSSNVFAGWERAKDFYGKRMNLQDKRAQIILNLAQEKYYFAAMPWMKDFLANERGKLDKDIDIVLTKMIQTVGVKQFETLPKRFLLKSRSASIYYILAKKYLRDRSYTNALKYLEKIPRNHEFYPYAKNMEATIFSITGKEQLANNAFRACREASSGNSRKRQLNKDFCTVGLARNEFGARNYDNAELLYLDIPKSSPVWPDILFEEAWTSYYKGDYNRSLGKLVSYKAPVFDYIFNPEIEVLSALSYLKMCLYTDAKTISDNFYKTYMADARKLRVYLKRKRNAQKFFYDLMIQFEKKTLRSNKLLNRLLKNIERDEAYRDLKNQVLLASEEYDRIRGKSNSRFKRGITGNIKEALLSQQKILGSYVRSTLISHYAKLYRAFEGMSYIKLEVLSQRKARLYSFDEKKRKRGDIQFLKRNEKQYFWDFNGEFWADELGDYVFALKSEC